MKKYITVIIFCINIFALFSQNLVPNPSFEDTVQCPIGYSEINYSLGWYSPTQGTPDFFDSCGYSSVSVPQNAFGWEPAKTGVAYIGICTAGKFSPSVSTI